MPLWIARDDADKGASRMVCAAEPKKIAGEWRTDDDYDPLFLDDEADVPLQLKPGEGPIEVKLVVVRKE